MPGEPRIEPVTEEQRQRADEAVAKLKRDLAEAAKRPRPPVTSPGKFTGPIGMDDEGNFLRVEIRRASGSMFGLAYGDALSARRPSS